MTSQKLHDMTVEELVSAYEAVVVKQDESFKFAEVQRFNQQFGARDDIAKELRSRPGDQREMLAALLKSEKAWVRICVAQDTFALNEARARRHIQYIIEHSRDPYRGEARSVLGAWDRGFRPS